MSLVNRSLASNANRLTAAKEKFADGMRQFAALQKSDRCLRHLSDSFWESKSLKEALAALEVSSAVSMVGLSQVFPGCGEHAYADEVFQRLYKGTL